MSLTKCKSRLPLTNNTSFFVFCTNTFPAASTSLFLPMNLHLLFFSLHLDLVHFLHVLLEVRVLGEPLAAAHVSALKWPLAAMYTTHMPS